MRNVDTAGKRALTLKGSLAIGSLAAVFISGCAADPAQKENLTAGYASLESRQYDDAIQRADAHLAKTPHGDGSAEALYLKGRAYEQRANRDAREGANNFSTARSLYTQALALMPPKPLDGYLQTGLGNVNYWLEDYSASLRAWSAAYDLVDAPELKAFVLYRAGLCQQRLGEFTLADQSFAAVQQRFPGTDAARRAHDHQGYRNFTVQLATFRTPQSADAAVTTLRKSGAPVQRATDPAGRSVISLSPVSTYPQAESQKARFAAQYPDALIVP